MRQVASLLALAACVHEPVTVAPHEIAAQIEALHRGERPTVPDTSGSSPHRLDIDDQVAVQLAEEVEHPGKFLPSGVHPTVRLTLRALIEDCPVTGWGITEDNAMAFPRCRLLHAGTRPVTVATHRRVHRGVVALAALGVASGGLVACAVECDGGWATASKVTLALTGTVLVAGTVLLLVVVSATKPDR